MDRLTDGRIDIQAEMFYDIQKEPLKTRGKVFPKSISKNSKTANWGRRKQKKLLVADMSVNGGGEGQPCTQLTLNFMLSLIFSLKIICIRPF